MVYGDCEKLGKEESNTFYTFIANMLFPTKIEILDTGTSIFCLTTRVIEPDQGDFLKMVHLFKYVRGTKYLPLILSADKSVMIKCYI